MTRIEKTLVNIDSVLSQSRSLIQKLTNFIQKDCLVEVAFESSVVLVISGEYSCVCVCVLFSGNVVSVALLWFRLGPAQRKSLEACHHKQSSGDIVELP